jgi:hypothetical protein
VPATLIPIPLSLGNTLPLFLEGLKRNLSEFALHTVFVAAAVIDMTKKTSVKIHIAFNIFLAIVFPP